MKEKNMEEFKKLYNYFECFNNFLDYLTEYPSVVKTYSEKLKNEIGEEVNTEEIVSFSPKDCEERVRVYFKPDDLNSLHIVVKDERSGDDFAGRLNIKKPYNFPKHDRRYGSRYYF